MLHFDVNNVWVFGHPKCSGLWLHIEVFGTPRNVGILIVQCHSIKSAYMEGWDTIYVETYMWNSE